MSWTQRIHKPSEVVSEGQVVDAVVIRVEPDKRRIALSMKQAESDPWAGVLESFTPDSIVTGKVAKLADFGAFIELAPGVEGLVHISELSPQRVNKVSDVVQPGQEVQVKVLGVDRKARRIALSIKAVLPKPEPAPQAETPAAKKPPKKPKKHLRGGLASHFDWGGKPLKL
jgi:small subunit ribosomal protein S1